jgi:hypothetical protein
MTQKRLVQLALVALVTLVLTATVSFAQGGQGGPPPYDKKTETTVKGPIQEVKLVDTPSGVKGTHLLLKQGSDTIEVFAGPAPYFEKNSFTFAKGDAVEVIGSKVDVNGVHALLARQIKKGGKTINPRDSDGQPNWRRQQ